MPATGRQKVPGDWPLTAGVRRWSRLKWQHFFSDLLELGADVRRREDRHENELGEADVDEPVKRSAIAGIPDATTLFGSTPGFLVSRNATNRSGISPSV